MEKMPMPSWDNIKSLIITSILSKQTMITAIACIESEVRPDLEHLKEPTFEPGDPAASFDRIFMAFKDIIMLKEELSENSGQQKEPLNNVEQQEKPLNKGKQQKTWSADKRKQFFTRHCKACLASIVVNHDEVLIANVTKEKIGDILKVTLRFSVMEQPLVLSHLILSTMPLSSY